MSATPLEAVKARDGIPNADQINALFKEWQPSYIVVGYPINMDGTKEELTFKARKFGNRLADKFKLKVYFKDERLTTADAKGSISSIIRGRPPFNIKTMGFPVDASAFTN